MAHPGDEGRSLDGPPAIRGEPDEVAPEWISGAYMARDEAIEQVKQAIDRGAFA